MACLYFTYAALESNRKELVLTVLFVVHFDKNFLHQ